MGEGGVRDWGAGKRALQSSDICISGCFGSGRCAVIHCKVVMASRVTIIVCQIARLHPAVQRLHNAERSALVAGEEAAT